MKGDRGPSRTTDVRIEPDAADVMRAAREHAAIAFADARAVTMRRELHLQTDRPIIMTGHQASWFHPGILAKYLACQALAEKIDGVCAWVVPDQDEGSFTTIDAPVRNGAGALIRQTFKLTDPSPQGAAAASIAPFKIDELHWPEEPALPSIRDGLESLGAAMRRHEEAPTAAHQIALATADLMSPLVSPAPITFATGLNSTTLFRELLERMRTDPDAVTARYNEAVARVPEARVSPLIRVPARNRYELPLWRLEPGRPRRAVFASDLAEAPIHELAPKALLFTGMLRLGACDLFIHGTGGGLYDRITEQWMDEWLGAPLAPMLTVTATLLLPLAETSVQPRDVEAALARAHRARHHPAEIGLTAEQKERDELARRVQHAKDNGGDPAVSFRALHEFLERHRAHRHDELEQLQSDAENLRARLNESEIAGDRTWPFFFHPTSALQDIDEAIRRRIGAPTAATPLT